jgi:hypothetical protein
MKLYKLGYSFMTCPQPAKYDYYSSGGTLGTFGTLQFNDPVQGDYLQNCSLIASFASLAWKGKINVQPAGPKITYSFQFYNPNKQQPADGKTPLDATGKLLHAKSETPTEIWPALYEKAYYMRLDQINDPSGRPDYCKYAAWQSPVTVLNQLTGMQALQKDCQRDFTGSDAVFSYINDNLCINYNPIATNRILKYPAVAWTYNPQVRNPHGVTFSATTIAAQHSYSLLGVTGTKSGTTWTSKYIVLRNPYGKGKGDPVGVSLYNGAWCGINLGISDGIFALAVDQFVKYFEGFTWVV